MALTCERCGTEFEQRQLNRANRFCSAACYNASGRPLRKQSVVGQRMRRAPRHPLAPPSGVVAECRLVLFDKIGAGPHACHWCGTEVDWRPGEGISEGALIADHLDWNQQNNSPDNLVPSCHICNSHRTREGDRRRIIDGELYVVNPNGTRHRAVEKPCEFCGKPFLAVLAQVRTGKGRFCSRSCARSRPTSSS